MADEGLGPSSHESSRVRLGGYPTRPEGQGMCAVRHERLDDYYDDDDDGFVKIDSAGVARGADSGAAYLFYLLRICGSKASPSGCCREAQLFSEAITPCCRPSGTPAQKRCKHAWTVSWSHMLLVLLLRTVPGRIALSFLFKITIFSSAFGR